jgi:hypothetical protein
LWLVVFLLLDHHRHPVLRDIDIIINVNGVFPTVPPWRAKTQAICFKRMTKDGLLLGVIMPRAPGGIFRAEHPGGGAIPWKVLLQIPSSMAITHADALQRLDVLPWGAMKSTVSAIIVVGHQGAVHPWEVS